MGAIFQASELGLAPCFLSGHRCCSCPISSQTSQCTTYPEYRKPPNGEYQQDISTTYTVRDPRRYHGRDVVPASAHTDTDSWISKRTGLHRVHLPLWQALLGTQSKKQGDGISGRQNPVSIDTTYYSMPTTDIFVQMANLFVNTLIN